MAINISDNSPRVSYTVGQGQTQTSFAVTFIFFDDADLNVYVDGVLKTLSSDYTVTGGDGATGTVTISVTGATGGSSVVVTRSIALERTSDFPTSGPFQVDALNTELDRLTGIVADLEDKADRGLQLTDYDLTANLVLPDLDGRKGRTLAFNEVSGAVEAGPTISDVQTVSAAAADIATLADIEDGTDATDAIQTAATNATAITTVSGSITNVNTVSTNIANVNTTATNIADVTSVATNMTEVLAADTNAATATTKAAEAAASATAAAASETAASTSETNAATSETNAASSATAAAGSATSASTAQTAAETAQTAAETAQTAAETAETNAATSETNAATSATNAATSATAAAASQVAAAASASSAASAYDTFDDRYLGSKTADPTVDNDGNALVQGALFFNSTANEMRVYDGSSWIAASSAGGASMLEYLFIATASQTAFSGSDENSNTLGYTVDNLIVIVNGVVLEPSVDYTATDGLTVTLTDAAALNDEVHIIAFKSFTTADMVSATNGGTFGNNVTVNGTLTATSLVGTGSTPSIQDNYSTTALTIDSGGQIGISGTTASFDTTGTVNGLQLYYETDAGIATVGSYSSGGNTDLSFHTNSGGGASSEQMRINSSGYVGIGTSSPARQLTVSNSGAALLLLESTGDDNGQILFGDSADGTVGKVGYSHSTNHMFFNTNGSEAMRINSSGHITTPKNPRFLATKSANSSWANAKIAFETGRIDNANNYDTTNSRFTAPVAGCYYFFVNLTILAGTDGSDDTMYWGLYKNGTAQETTQDNWRWQSRSGGSGVEFRSSFSAIIDLAANDYVEVHSSGISTTNGFIRGAGYSNFGGYLIG